MSSLFQASTKGVVAGASNRTCCLLEATVPDVTDRRTTGGSRHYRCVLVPQDEPVLHEVLLEDLEGSDRSPVACGDEPYDGIISRRRPPETRSRPVAATGPDLRR
jgi:hypothetical protein